MKCINPDLFESLRIANPLKAALSRIPPPKSFFRLDGWEFAFPVGST